MQVGFRCPRGEVDYATCRDCRSNPVHPCGIPAPLLKRLEDKATGGEDLGEGYTPSRLLGCYRQPILEKDTPYYLSVANSVSSLRGELIHTGLEQESWDAIEVITEKRLSCEVQTIRGLRTFQAKPDAIVVVDEVTGPVNSAVVIDLWDWKTREFEKDMTEADKKHAMQVWMYAYIVSRTAEQWYGRPANVIIRSVNICYISSSGTRIFSSLGEGVAYNNRGRGKTAYVEELRLEAIPTLTMDRVEQFIAARIAMKERALTVLPPALSGDDAKWCFRCPVFARCKAMGEDEVELPQAA